MITGATGIGASHNRNYLTASLDFGLDLAGIVSSAAGADQLQLKVATSRLSCCDEPCSMACFPSVLQ